MLRELPNLTISGNGKFPRLPFLSMKEAVLGRRYELSIIFTTAARSRRLNRSYRGKDKPTNILSFPLSRTKGEIYLNLAEIKKWRGEPAFTGERLIAFFLIHGLLHLKGMRHGRTMEALEKRYRKRFHVI